MQPWTSIHELNAKDRVRVGTGQRALITTFHHIRIHHIVWFSTEEKRPIDKKWITMDQQRHNFAKCWHTKWGPRRRQAPVVAHAGVCISQWTNQALGWRWSSEQRTSSHVPNNETSMCIKSHHINWTYSGYMDSNDCTQSKWLLHGEVTTGGASAALTHHVLPL